MYAVIRAGGKQYRVSEGDTLSVERDVLGSEKDGKVELDVMMLGGDEPKVGSPLVDGATVKAKILGEERGKKIIVFRRKRRKQYKRKTGHRQNLVNIRIEKISV
ncbi:MAG: 50S ribosomal protein L21 [Acidobacteria bacterium]|nr:50S ribosomal protein L21 [Acidobacteriota bacterium]